MIVNICLRVSFMWCYYSRQCFYITSFRRGMLWVIVVLVGLHATSGLRVLSVLPFPQKSHHIMFNALLGELVNRGHEVTVYSGHRINTNASNYRHHHIATSMDAALDDFTFDMLKVFTEREPIFSSVKIQPYGINISDETLSLPQIKKLVVSTETFDVVVLETMFAQEALLGLGYRFDAPVVTLSTFGPISLTDSVMGNPNPLAYLSSFQLPYNSRLTFPQRVRTVSLYLSEHVSSYFWHIPHQQAVLEKHFTNSKPTPLPSLMEMLTNMAVVLMNIQPEVTSARAFVPNMVSVGGMHIPQERKLLPQSLAKFMDESSHGVIYFSLGSTFSGSSMPQYFLEAFVTAFQQIPERVLWKIDKTPANLSSNVMTVQWAPQTDILAHPKCKGFITHGGLLSLLEATHFAIPLIGVPIFADQGWNVAKIEEVQTGVKLKISSVSAASVSSALKEILHNPIYKRNMNQLSAQMRDRLVSPLDTAVYWVEYVARHQGAPQLRTPARTMSSFQYLLIDVVLFVIFVFIILLISLHVLIRKICNIIILMSVKKSSVKHKSKRT